MKCKSLGSSEKSAFRQISASCASRNLRLTLRYVENCLQYCSLLFTRTAHFSKLPLFLLFITLYSITTVEAEDKALDTKATNDTDQIELMKISLGTMLFFDVNLSKNRTMSCATCHNPAKGFVDQRGLVQDNMASIGDDGTSIGSRNAPSAAYAMLFPQFQLNTNKKTKDKSAFIGGQFWDGRAKDLAAQAGGPPTNMIEMGMPDKKSVITRIQENPSYVEHFKSIYGDDIFDDTEKAYQAMTEAIGEFEKTELFAPFDSKYDRYLRGEYELTVLEDLGRSIFFSNANNSCASCHLLHKEDAPKEPFTNFEYRNIGTPANTALQTLTNNSNVDLGLWHNPKAQTDSSKGKFKTPSLRNTAVTGPYMHNGVFKDLRTVVLFYDKYNNPKRVINPETGKPWAEPEVKENIALDDLKAKALSERKVDALVAFMELLTDKRYEPLLEQKKSKAQALK